MRNNNSFNHIKKEKDDNNSELSIDFSLITDNKEPIDSLIEDNLKETLPYLKEQGLFLEDTKYYKQEIESIESSYQRVIHISRIVLEKLQKTEFIKRNLRKMWDVCNNEKDAKKKKIILLRIIAIQYYLSYYHKVIKEIITQEINNNNNI